MGTPHCPRPRRDLIRPLGSNYRLDFKCLGAAVRAAGAERGRHQEDPGPKREDKLQLRALVNAVLHKGAPRLQLHPRVEEALLLQEGSAPAP